MTFDATALSLHTSADTADHQLALALAILPALPAEVDAYRSSGAATVLHAYGTDGQRMQALMPRAEAHRQSTVILPIRNVERGGYDIACQVREVYYESASVGRVELSVSSVSRLKPYRAVARAHLAQLALVSVLAGRELQTGEEFDAPLVDISTHGLAIVTGRRLARGDLVSVTTQLESDLCRVSARVVHVTPAPYGRRRIGCQILDPEPDALARLARFLRSRPTIPADRRASERAA